MAERLWLDDPDQVALDIIELRAYARAKAEYDAAGGRIEKLEKSPLMDEVILNDFRLSQERDE